MGTPEQKRMRRIPMEVDGANIQSRTPYPDDTIMQEPDEIFLTELIQKTENEIDRLPKSVIGKIHGIIRTISDVTIKETTFKKPVETQFTLLESAGQLGIARFDEKKHGPWEDIEDTDLTPVAFIHWYQQQEEPTPGLLKDFINLRKQQSASKMHWKTEYHPTPKRQTE